MPSKASPPSPKKIPFALEPGSPQITIHLKTSHRTLAQSHSWALAALAVGPTISAFRSPILLAEVGKLSRGDPETGQSFKLYPAQDRFLHEALQRIFEGWMRYTELCCRTDKIGQDHAGRD